MTNKSYNQRLADIAQAIADQAPVVVNVAIYPKGEYNAGTAYVVGDSVSYQGSSYICRAATTGNAPTNTTYWQLLAAGLTVAVNNVSTNTAAGSSSLTNYVYNCTGTMTLTMPTAVGNSDIYYVKKLSTGTLTIATTGGETIDGSSSLTVTVADTALLLISDGTNWRIY